MSQMEMFPEVVETEKTILELRAYWSDWDKNKKLYTLPKKEDNRKAELLTAWRSQMKNFTYA